MTVISCPNRIGKCFTATKYPKQNALNNQLTKARSMGSASGRRALAGRGRRRLPRGPRGRRGRSEESTRRDPWQGLGRVAWKVGAESRRRYGCSLVCNLYRMSVPSGIGVRLKPSGICYESYDSLFWKCDLILIEKNP